MPSAPADLLQRVADILARMRPAIRADGGDIELVDVDNFGVVRIRMLGACIGCPSSDITLKLGIERTLKEKVPEVLRVEQVS